MSDVIAVLKASAPRRAMGVGMLAILGALLVYLAMVETPGELTYTVFMIIVGVAALYNARRMWFATGVELQLTNEALTSSTGELVCRVDQIEKVDRGMFAFKPSNGFLIKLKEPMPRGWAPGIWWRVGTRIGVGGVTAPAEGKMLADTLSAMVAKRDGVID